MTNVAYEKGGCSRFISILDSKSAHSILKNGNNKQEQEEKGMTDRNEKPNILQKYEMPINRIAFHSTQVDSLLEF